MENSDAKLKRFWAKLISQVLKWVSIRRLNMAGGYMGKVLFVDLSQGELKDEAFDEKLCCDFIGGYGTLVLMLKKVKIRI
ncbi:hypothetical protein ES704_03208 [subsurface metagenome]|jgi:hypothetical protein